MQSISQNIFPYAQKNWQVRKNVWVVPSVKYFANENTWWFQQAELCNYYLITYHTNFILHYLLPKSNFMQRNSIGNRRKNVKHSKETWRLERLHIRIECAPWLAKRFFSHSELFMTWPLCDHHYPAKTSFQVVFFDLSLRSSGLNDPIREQVSDNNLKNFSSCCCCN